MLPLFRRLPMAACSVALLLLLAGCNNASETDMVAAARTAMAAGKYKEAAIQLKSALQKSSSNGEARFLMGALMLRIGEPAQARIELNKAHDLKFDDNQVVPAMAQAMYLTGQSKPLIDVLAKTALSDPKANAELKAYVAAAMAATGSETEARSTVAAALALDSRNITARMVDARLRAGAGRIDEAVTLVEQVAKDDPKLRDAWQLLGDLYWIGKNDAKTASSRYEKAVEIDPLFQNARVALILIALQESDIEGFRRRIKDLKAATPNSFEARYYSAQVALLDEDYKRAREEVEQLLRVAPTNTRILQLAGAMEQRAGSLVVAETHLARALQINQNLPVARRMLAEVHLGKGDVGKALTVLQPLLESQQAGPEAFALAAEAYLLRGDLDNAERFFGIAAKANPDNPRFATALALAQIARGNRDAGFTRLESLAAKNDSTVADMALIAARTKRGEYDLVLKDIDRLEGKLKGSALPALMRGRILAQRGDVPGARQSFERALTVQPAFFPALAALGSLDEAAGDLPAARKRYEAFIAANPGNQYAMVALAEVLRKTRAPNEEVVKLLTEAIKQAPSDPGPRLSLIEHYLRVSDQRSALTTAQEASSALPNDTAIMESLGRTLLVSGDTQQALSTFGKIAALQPKAVTPLVRIAEVHMRTRAYPSALNALGRALAIDPESPAAQRYVSMISRADDQSATALSVARDVQKQHPKRAAGFLLESEILAQQKKFGPAIEAVKAAQTRSPGTVGAIRLHALYVANGRPAEADKVAAEWEAGHPKDAPFQTHLGMMAIEAKDWAKAETRFRRVIAQTPDDPRVLNNLAWVLMQQNKTGAIEFAERAYTLSPTVAQFMDTYALALSGAGQPQKALEIQRKALEQDPDNVGMRLNLARILVQAGQAQPARQELERLAKLGSSFEGQAQVQALLKTLPQ